jgi:putative ABC transport system substrate-binding protein
MRRREFITLLGGAAAAWPLAATAQQAAGMVRLGYLGFATAVQNSRSRNAFLAGLRDLGYVEGKNFQIEFRYADGDNDLLAGLAAELVRLNVDVIVTYATGVPVAQRATSTIPVVMVGYTDAVATGMIASLAHPGGNVTGSTFFHPELMAKRLELLKELTPSIDRAGAFLFRRSEANGPILKAMGNTARTLGVTLHPIELDKPTDLEGAFSALASQQVRALVSGDHSFFNANSDAIAVLAAKHRVLSVGALELAANGGLMAYGVNFSDQFRRAAVFVDKILKGAKAGDIPVEQASKFTTIINIKTAKALGIEMPTSLLLRADEVIE